MNNYSSYFPIPKFFSGNLSLFNTFYPDIFQHDKNRINVENGLAKNIPSFSESINKKSLINSYY